MAIKWYLHDEPLVAEASIVLRDFQSEQVRLLAPEHIRNEVASALLNATRHPARLPHLTLGTNRRLLDLFLKLDLELVPQDGLIAAAYDLAGFYGCSFYDGLFLATAQMTNSQFIHADLKLRGALKGRFPLELWIEGYASPAVSGSI